MESGPTPPVDPMVDELAETFHVYGVRRDGDRLLYFGEPLIDRNEVESALWPVFREAGYEITLRRQPRGGGDVGHVIVAEPVHLGLDGIPWTNLVLFVATLFSTLYVGAIWYHIDLSSDPTAIMHAWPFALGVMGVLGIHELGHYAMSRYHGVKASLPYFLPVPTIFGTMGAVIKISGRIPSRKALFDIGVAGPIAGIVATVVVTVVGLHLPPVTAPSSVVESDSAIQLVIGYPPLMEALALVFDQPLRFEDPATAVNPLVIAGWLGMFITFLNLIPVGQLDGGHVTRAMFGPIQPAIGRFVPVGLFALAATLYVGLDVPFHAIGVWVFWGVFAGILALVGPARPIDDARLDTGRKTIGLITFAVGILCFVPVPIEIVSM
ncbi:MAG: site-2 protease family protein [Halobacteriota archaeon]